MDSFLGRFAFLGIVLVSGCLAVPTPAPVPPPTHPPPGITSVAGPTSLSTSYGKWSIKTEKAYDFSQIAILTLRAEKELTQRQDRYLPVLTVFCESEGLAVSIQATRRGATNADALDISTVNVQFDGEASTATETALSTDGNNALYFKEPRPLLEQLLKHQTMRVQFSPPGAAPVETTFDLEGLARAVEPFTGVCKVRPKNPA